MAKIKSFEDICYFSTTNKVHSNKRRKNNLFYIESAKDVLATKKHYKDTLLKSLRKITKNVEHITIDETFLSTSNTEHSDEAEQLFIRSLTK